MYSSIDVLKSLDQDLLDKLTSLVDVKNVHFDDNWGTAKSRKGNHFVITSRLFNAGFYISKLKVDGFLLDYEDNPIILVISENSIDIYSSIGFNMNGGLIYDKNNVNIYNKYTFEESVNYINKILKDYES